MSLLSEVIMLEFKANKEVAIKPSVDCISETHLETD